MEATAVKTGKRMEQALDKQAQALIQTVKIARTEAFEAELSELNGKFRTNKPFMFQIAAISKNESLALRALGKGIDLGLSVHIKVE